MGREVETVCCEYHRKWLVWHLLCEIWMIQGLLVPAADEDEEERTQNENKSRDTALLLTATTAHRAVPRLPLNRGQLHLLVQLRLLSELILLPPAPMQRCTGTTAAPSTGSSDLHRPAPNLDSTGLAAQPSVLDGLLTLATGVVEVMTGFHIAGGIAAMLHGAFRIAAPDSPLTKVAAACRKALTPGLTVIQESVKMMAPLPDNEHSGLRDALCFATYQITGVEVGALKHQLCSPGNTRPPSPSRSAYSTRRVMRSAQEGVEAPTRAAVDQPVVIAGPSHSINALAQKDASQDQRITDEEIARAKQEMSRRGISRGRRGFRL